MTLPYENATSGKSAVEVGMLSFEAAFLGQIMLPNGCTVMDMVEQKDILRLSQGAPN